MSKEKLVLNDLLSWQDIINFSLPNYRFGCNFLEKSYSKKNEIDFLTDYIRTFIGNAIREKFPNFPFDNECFDYHFYINKNEDNKYGLYLSFTDLFSDLLTSCANCFLDRKKLANLLQLNSPNLKEDIIKELKIYKDQINYEISKCNNGDILIGYNPEFDVYTSRERLQETLIAKRKMIIWVIRNYDELYDFVQQPLDLNMLNILNKDKFLLVMMSFALKHSGILIDQLSSSSQDDLEIINNYLLLIDYLNLENDQEYYTSFSTLLRNGQELLVTSDTIRSNYQKFYVQNWQLIDSFHFASSYEEVLRNKAVETWNAIQNKKLAQKIRLNWEMIPAGNKISLANYQAGAKTRIVSSDSDKQAKLKKDYDLVEDKMNYFSSTNPLFELTGIDTFEGYSAYMYPNGVVVFEKFFKQSGKANDKSMLVPVSGEAIYVMNFREFADLSRYTKIELIQEIHDFNNPDVKRIYHTPNGSWKDKVSKVITGPGYGVLDLEQIDVLANELVSESKQKCKLKEE